LFSCRRTLALLAAAALLAGSGACHHRDSSLPEPGSVDADKFLFDKGTDLLKKKNWITAREYFKKIIDTYPQSQYRHEARLGVGDSYLGENRTESYILGVNEFRQVLQFAPLNPKADYAQYKICLGESKQMLGAQRDQTATREALADCDTFLRNYPTSALRPEVEKLRRQARDRLSDHEFGVGLTYFRIHNYQGADSRFHTILVDDPAYTHIDRVYFYLAETISRGQRPKEALPLYERLIAECPKSEFLKKAQARAAALKR
jgi:outer membrane protein assembly factor BamD